MSKGQPWFLEGHVIIRKIFKNFKGLSKGFRKNLTWVTIISELMFMLMHVTIKFLTMNAFLSVTIGKIVASIPMTLYAISNLLISITILYCNKNRALSYPTLCVLNSIRNFGAKRRCFGSFVWAVRIVPQINIQITNFVSQRIRNEIIDSFYPLPWISKSGRLMLFHLLFIYF